MKKTLVLLACVQVLPWGPQAGAVEYEREVVLEIGYGEALDEVGIYTPSKEYPEGDNVGPDCFEVAGDSLMFIADVVNRKVKCFRIGGGLVWATEGEVECAGSMAVGNDGSIYVRGGGGHRDITVLDRDGKKKAKIPRMLFSSSGAESQWTPARIDSLIYEARSAGLDEPILRDESGKRYTYQRVPGEPLVARFSKQIPGGSRSDFELRVDSTTLTNNLSGVTIVNYWLVDGRGRLYAICYAPRTHSKVIAEWEDREPLVSQSDVVVRVYDQGGRLLGGIRFNSPPAHMSSGYNDAKVMPNGNIYCYNYTAAGLQVVRYRPIEED